MILRVHFYQHERVNIDQKVLAGFTFSKFIDDFTFWWIFYLFFSWFQRKKFQIETPVIIPANSETNDPLRGMTVIPFLEVSISRI